MTESTDRQLEEANGDGVRDGAVFVSEIELMIGRWDAVAPTYILETALMDLSEGLADLGEELNPAVDRRRAS